MAVAVQTTAITNYVQSTTPAINMPSGIVAGDLLIAVLHTRVDDADPTATGWTKVKKQDNQLTNAYLGGFIYSKVADGTEGATVTFTLATNYWTAAAVYRISGQDTTTPVSASNGANVNVTATPSFAAAITPTVANSLLIMALFSVQSPSNNSAYAITTSDPGGWTEVTDQLSFSPSAIGVGVSSAYSLTRPQTTSTGNFSAAGGSAGNTNWSGILISISPSLAVAAVAIQSNLSLLGAG